MTTDISKGKAYNFHEVPDKQRREEWLNSELQKKLCHFKSNKATIYEQWTLLLECNYPAQH